MSEDKLQKIKADWQLFIKYCPEICESREIELFVPCFCPISLVDADVEEYIVEEYDSVELLVLRMYRAGIRTVEGMAKITGIDEAMISKLLQAEMYTYGHIHPETGEILPAGYETLKDNENSKELTQHALYNVKRELQVDSITGSLVRYAAEMRKDKMMNLRDNFNPNLLPKESVVIDKSLEDEITNRLAQYISKQVMDAMAIKSISQLKTKEIKYRPAYFVLVKGFEYPILAFKYHDKTDAGITWVVRPIAMAAIDYAKLNLNGEVLPYISRNNDYFDYLKSYTDQFREVEIVDVDELMKQAENEIDDDTDVEKILENMDVENEYDDSNDESDIEISNMQDQVIGISNTEE